MTGRRSASSSAGRSGAAAPRPLVLLDANALFLPFTAGVALEAEVARWNEAATLAVPTGPLGELDRLVRRGVAHAAAARALADRFPELRTTRRGDDGLLRLARERHAAVVTADRELRDRLVRAGVWVLYPRDRARLTPFPPRAGAPAGGAARATVKKRARLARR